MTRREARQWIRRHWQEFMRCADTPDLRGVMPPEDDDAIANAWTDECLRLADRLEPRVRKSRSQENSNAE